MADLELVGIHPDGDHLILIGPDDDRHRLAIDEALRVAVRRDRPQLEKLRSDAGLRPRDIQAMIRSGASAEDVADQAGLPVQQVRRYEGPVLAERDHAASRARALRVGRDTDSPSLGDLVLDRLAARGVEPDSLTWDARKRGQESWELLARFEAGERDREAVWRIDLTSGTFVALDDESRWLSETDLAPGSRHLSSVRGSALYDVENDGDIAPALHAVDAVIRDSRPRVVPDPPPAEPEPEQDEAAATEAMLAELDASRGVRQPVEIDDDALAEQVLAEQEPAESPLTLFDDPPAAHPPASAPQEARDATVLSAPSASSPAEEERSGGARPESSEQRPPSRRSRRSRRTSVPSWDEIVFGAKGD